MKIKYEFATETVEIEVADEWATVIADLDREEYNANHKETRRHCSLEAYDADGNLLPSDVDIVGEYIKNDENKKLHEAINILSPAQKQLLSRIYFGGENAADIAREEGVSKVAINHRLEKIFAKLRKKLSEGG